MFVSTHHHKRETDRLTAELKDRDERIAALERRVVEAERTRHEFIEEIRYVIEAGGDYLFRNDRLRGDHLRTVGHVLPYLLSGRRHWIEPELPGVTDSAVLSAKLLAAEYGFSLPDDPQRAVKAMLDLATVLFNPARLSTLERLRNHHPLAQSDARERSDLPLPKAILLKPDGSIATIDLLEDEDTRLRQLQELVGGPIEGVPLSDGRYMLVNENGKEGAHLFNRPATDLAHSHEAIMASDYIAGVAVILSKEALGDC